MQGAANQEFAVLEAIIHRVPFFATLPPRHIRWLAETLRAEDIRAGTVLFREGEVGDRFYVILQGQFEIFKQFEDGGEQVIAIRGPGEYIGEMSLLHPMGLRTASVRARDDGEVLMMTRIDFDALLERYPKLGYQLARVLGERLGQAHASSLKRLEERNRALQAALDELHAAQTELIDKQMLEHELALARDIQMDLLPPALPALKGFDFGAKLAPMRQVGGDFYDFIQLGDGELGIAIGDVSGHGMPAALIMAITLALLRAEACRGCSPGEVLRSLNRELLKLGSTRMFVTVLYGVLHPSSGDFVFACAGHEPPVLSLPGTAPCFPDFRGGPLLGLFEDVTLSNYTLALPPDGSFVLYTDGVIETRNLDREFFSEERLMDLVLQAGTWSAQTVCEGIMAAVASHGAGLPQQDDITVICARRLGKQAGDELRAQGE